MSRAAQRGGAARSPTATTRLFRPAGYVVIVRHGVASLSCRRAVPALFRGQARSACSRRDHEPIAPGQHRLALRRGQWSSLHTAEATGSKPVTPTSTNTLPGTPLRRLSPATTNLEAASRLLGVRGYGPVAALGPPCAMAVATACGGDLTTSCAAGSRSCRCRLDVDRSWRPWTAEGNRRIPCASDLASMPDATRKLHQRPCDRFFHPGCSLAPRRRRCLRGSRGSERSTRLSTGEEPGPPSSIARADRWTAEGTVQAASVVLMGRPGMAATAGCRVAASAPGTAEQAHVPIVPGHAGPDREGLVPPRARRAPDPSRREAGEPEMEGWAVSSQGQVGDDGPVVTVLADSFPDRLHGHLRRHQDVVEAHQRRQRPSVSWPGRCRSPPAALVGIRQPVPEEPPEAGMVAGGVEVAGGRLRPTLAAELLVDAGELRLPPEAARPDRGNHVHGVEPQPAVAEDDRGLMAGMPPASSTWGSGGNRDQRGDPRSPVPDLGHPVREARKHAGPQHCRGAVGGRPPAGRRGRERRSGSPPRSPRHPGWRHGGWR
jgi:hypothetical protein